jgi:hypothetical protein
VRRGHIGRGGREQETLVDGEAEVLAALMSTIPAEDARVLLTAAPILSALADLPAPPGPVATSAAEAASRKRSSTASCRRNDSRICSVESASFGA